MNVRFALKPTIIPSGGGPDGKSPVLLRTGWELDTLCITGTAGQSSMALMLQSFDLKGGKDLS